MTGIHALSIGVGAVTTVCYSAAMLRFFTPARERSARRLGMTVSFCVCNAVQLAGLVESREVGLAWRLAGLGLFALAHVLFWSALAAHWRRPPAIVFSERPPCSLVMTGPYALVRHPFYTSYMVAWLAGACVTANPYLLLTFVWMFVYYYRAALGEEGQLLNSAAFGAAYEDYRQRTGRFLPKLL